jgi:hypothetical protein
MTLPAIEKSFPWVVFFLQQLHKIQPDLSVVVAVQAAVLKAVLVVI